MPRDLIIGILVSALLHGGVLFSDRFIPQAAPVKKQVEEMPTIEVIEMPRLEPDEPEVLDLSDESLDVPDFAPPMQTDMPQIAAPDSFVQKVQPPPPDNVKPAAGIITIPENRATDRFRGMEVFDISNLDQIPVPRFQARPQYPFEMRRAGIAGEVVVDFIVDTKGDVQNAYAIRSSQREFEAAAVQAVSKWKFRAGRKGGRNVNTHMQVPIVFTLNEE
jgi:periplasmic protein TonB